MVEQTVVVEAQITNLVVTVLQSTVRQKVAMDLLTLEAEEAEVAHAMPSLHTVQISRLASQLKE